MTWTVTSVDYTTLPAALLPMAKKHCRVDFTDDDEYIQGCLARSIALLEQKWGLRVFAAETDWQPEVTGAAELPCPVWPVSDFEVMSGPTDISADFNLRYSSLTAPWWLVHSDGTPFPADCDVALTAGYADPDTMPPNMLDAILRLAATLYEYRETVAASSLDTMPGWLDDMIVGLWVPRA